jgi:penicillin amidase
MFLTLQTMMAIASDLATMHDVLPPEMFDLMAPAGTEWDAPVIGLPFETAPIPGPDVYNLRRIRTGKPEVDLQRRQEVARLHDASPWTPPEDDVALGSNNWAVGGRLARDGGALVANDMHLAIRVPNTWYRARLGNEADANGCMSWSAPSWPSSLVTGSNTHVAWGFTNTYAD